MKLYSDLSVKFLPSYSLHVSFSSHHIFTVLNIKLIEKFIDSILVCGSVNKYVDSWTGNVKGQLEIPITEDISTYTITLQTDVELSNIQANILFVFLSEFLTVVLGVPS